MSHGHYDVTNALKTTVLK